MVIELKGKLAKLYKARFQYTGYFYTHEYTALRNLIKNNLPKGRASTDQETHYAISIDVLEPINNTSRDTSKYAEVIIDGLVARDLVVRNRIAEIDVNKNTSSTINNTLCEINVYNKDTRETLL